MKQITVTEFRKNIKKYSVLAKQEDFEVVSRGKVLFIIKGPQNAKKEALNRILGAAPSNIPYEVILKEKQTDII